METQKETPAEAKINSAQRGARYFCLKEQLLFTARKLNEMGWSATLILADEPGVD